MRCCALAFLGTAVLGGCSDNSSGGITNYDAASAELQNDSGTLNAVQSLNAAEAALPEPVPTRTHNYDFVEGDFYGYLGAVSEEDQKKGVAAPPVVRFRYTGFWSGAQHLQAVDDNGAVTESDECDVPCVAIKEIGYGGTVRRVGYSTQSIIGSAFEDAINGRLRRSPQPGTIKDGYKFIGGDPGVSANWRMISPPPAASSWRPPPSDTVIDNTTDSNTGAE